SLPSCLQPSPWTGPFRAIVAQCTPKRPGHNARKEHPPGRCFFGADFHRARPPCEQRSRRFMFKRYSRLSTAVVLLAGLIAGWCLSLVRPLTLHAGAGDRLGETILTTGPVLVRYDEATKSPIALDAVYILDYKGGRLLASLPTYRQSTSSTTIIESFVERDLVADLKLDLDTGRPPHFLMTTGALGPYTAGWAPLYVVQTT